jgi:hypothetical protein
MKRTILSALLVAALLGALAPATVLAAAPGNDNLANATVIDPSALPFTETVAMDEATAEGESTPCGAFGSVAQSVWYSITPSTSGILAIDESAHFPYQVLVVSRVDGPGLGGLTTVSCSTWYYGQSNAVLQVEAGTTYAIMIGASFHINGTVDVTVRTIPPPQNDHFADAKIVSGSLPFRDSTDLTAASLDAAEPQPSCASGPSAGTIWYAFTPLASRSYTMSASPGWFFLSQMAAYTGTSLASLSEVACTDTTRGEIPLTFHADAGTTYWIQVGPRAFGSTGAITVELALALDPVAWFNYYPPDPSTFDTIYFGDYSQDPAQAGIVSSTWTFGDGASVVDPTSQPSHKYASDGSYTVRLAIVTKDGRTASMSQTIVVSTHDVAITKFTVPSSASRGQTRSITVGLSNRRYADEVSVTLFKLTPSGQVQIGTSTQIVPMRSGNRTTDFTFSYTFTPDDAALGKVSFQATATLTNYRDVAPGDNQAQSLPTKVNK